jgi:Fe-S-cluster containining protein
VSYRELLAELDEWFARGVAEAGPGVVLCKRGCSACCHGPFDISPADAEQVMRAVASLDVATQREVRERASAQAAAYRRIEPGWASPWDVGVLGDDRFDALTDRLASLPCPALGEGGACLIYQDRPATCRMIGLSMRTPSGDTLENACPILLSSEAYATLNPTLFDLESFEERAEDRDIEALERDRRYGMRFFSR